MKKSKAKKKLIKALENLTYEDLVSVVDWLKVAKCLAKESIPEVDYEPTIPVKTVTTIRTPNTSMNFVGAEDLWKRF